MQPQDTQFDPSMIPTQFSPYEELDTNQNRFAGDDRLFVKFHTEAVMNPFKSTQAGRQVFDEVDMVTIRTPGSQLTSVVAPMKGEYLARFRKQYENWKATKENIMSGTPLESFPFLLHKPGLVAELKAMHIHTVEQLANIPDDAKGKIMGGYEISKRAAEWINATTGTDATVAKMAKENDDLKAQMAVMQEQMAQILAGQEAAKPKGK